MQKKRKNQTSKIHNFWNSDFSKKMPREFRLKMTQIFIKKSCRQKIITFSYLFKQMRFKQFLPLLSNFDLDIRILRVKVYKTHLFLSGDILLHTGGTQLLDYLAAPPWRRWRSTLLSLSHSVLLLSRSHGICLFKYMHFNH